MRRIISGAEELISHHTLGKSGFIKRTGYAASRSFVTINDAGKNTFNFSEIGGLERQLRLAVATIQDFQ